MTVMLWLVIYTVAGLLMASVVDITLRDAGKEGLDSAALFLVVALLWPLFLVYGLAGALLGLVDVVRGKR